MRADCVDASCAIDVKWSHTRPAKSALRSEPGELVLKQGTDKTFQTPRMDAKVSRAKERASKTDIQTERARKRGMSRSLALPLAGWADICSEQAYAVYTVPQWDTHAPPCHCLHCLTTEPCTAARAVTHRRGAAAALGNVTGHNSCCSISYMPYAAFLTPLNGRFQMFLFLFIHKSYLKIVHLPH